MSISVGFVGLGNMGLPMAQNLIKAGHVVHVYNRTKSRADALLAQGAAWAASPRAVAEQKPIVLSILADDAGAATSRFG